MRPLLCVLGLGHRWETHSDAEGSVTSCRRCGKLRHVGAADLRAIVDDTPGNPRQSYAESAMIHDTQYLDP